VLQWKIIRLKKKDFSGISEMIYSVILFYLLEDNTIDDKMTNAEIWDKVKACDLTEYVKKIKFSISINSEFRDGIEYAISQEQYFIAVILAGTELEHILNQYYNEWFDLKKIERGKDAIRALSFFDKCKWFFKISASKEIPSRLLEKLVRINKLRNDIIHYKTFTKLIDLGKQDTIIEKIENELGLIEKLPEIMVEFEEFLETTMCELFPNRRIAYDLYERMFCEDK